MKSIFIILFILTITNCFAEEDSIIYNFPPKVIDLIEKEISNNFQFYRPDLNQVYILLDDDGDTIRCYLSINNQTNYHVTDTQKFLAKLILNSRRYVQLGNFYLAIIFPLDFELTIGRNIINEGYCVKFTQYGDWVVESK